MKTQHEAVIAYATLIRLGPKVTGKTAFALFKLKQSLQATVTFQSEEEMKLVEKCGGTVSENGRIDFSDKAKQDEFLKEQKELLNMECDPDIQPVKVSIDAIPDITMADIESLDGFVIFE